MSLEREARKRGLPIPEARRSLPPFPAWLAGVSPTFRWDWPHLVHIQAELDRITRGEIDRLMLFLPPRHGKSEQATVRYPVWRMEREPSCRVVVAAYNETLAMRFSRKARRLAMGRVQLARDRTAVLDWETTSGGGLRAVGVGGGVTGQGFDLLIIDDPVKSREEAESETYRDRVWDWYRDDLYTRTEPGAALVLIMTRWHEDDLAGRLLREMNSGEGDTWTVVNLPALAEENDPLGRPVGAALCPDRYDEAALARRKAVLGTYSFTALYQQRPLPAEGGMFRREWFRIIDAAPAIGERVRYWDKASTDGDGDYTAGVLMSRGDDGIYTVLDVVRGQWSSGARSRIMRQTAELDGVDVRITVEQEPGSGGADSARADIVDLAGFTVHAERPSGDKAVRAEPFAAQCEAGNVRIVRGPWNGAYLDELAAFPMGTHDDQVDASSGAFNRLASAMNFMVY